MIPAQTISAVPRVAGRRCERESITVQQRRAVKSRPWCPERTDSAMAIVSDNSHQCRSADRRKYDELTDGQLAPTSNVRRYFSSYDVRWFAERLWVIVASGREETRQFPESDHRG
jgi:hypothetical protein